MRLRKTGIIAVVTCLPLVFSGPAVAEPADSPTMDDVPAAESGGTIPLITGDRVVMRPDGLFQVEPGPGREDIGFVSPSAPDGSGDLMIVPSDAATPLANGVLDDRLFNVSALARQGYLGADAVPLLVQDADGAEAREVSDADTAEFWDDLSEDGLSTASVTGPSARKLWLDDATDRDAALPDPGDAITAEEPPADAQQVTVHFTAPGGGAPDQAQVNLQNLATGKVYYLRLVKGDTAATGTVPPGEYTGLAHQRVEPADGKAGRVALTFHELTVADRAVEKSVGSELEPITFDVERDDARMHSIEMKMQANLPGVDYGMSFTSIQTGQWDFYSAPTGDARVLFSVRPTLTGPADGNGDTDYSYHLVFHNDNGVPDDLSFAVDDGDLARRTSKYHSRGQELSMLRNSYGKVSSGHDSGFVIPRQHVSAPSTRDEYYTADPAVEWFQIAEFGDATAPDTLVRYGGFYKPGKRTVVWGGAPVGPGLIPSRFAYSMSRVGDRIVGITPLFSGPDASEATWSRTGVTGSATLSRDGVVVGSHTARPESQNFSLPANDAGDYTLAVEGTRSVPWSDLGSSASAEWRFHSEPSASRTPLDLQVVGMSASGVKNGYASARMPQVVTVDVHRQGAETATRKLSLKVSYDDGETWVKVPLLRDGDRAVTVLTHPRDAEFVSVRLSAADDAGNAVTQTTIRSYGLR
ncbi:hypothetical protein [Stackebrandtia nassauensis]|uniref:Uncharacterized protein n=1 Tax=Stackebrandtia nassauensis (strain DSM 44728 / CIP 108903 / NRRL B-16338 / NBRC 102104 / LLR-40K-21) TaxID=446470 RepID=D3PXN9_STANL|nr:hypothetical protein [Stackebrandtia nassauensis]ADD43369.1 hypothetical protein Snas_3712 [Stackebrandtia nassauensis DSM 44728]